MTRYAPSSHEFEPRFADEQPRTTSARPARSGEKPGQCDGRSLSASGRQFPPAGDGAKDCAVVASGIARSAVPPYGGAVVERWLSRLPPPRLFFSLRHPAPPPATQAPPFLSPFGAPCVPSPPPS